MKLSCEEVRHISLLARLGLDEAEIEQFRLQLSDILENFEILKEANTGDLKPTAQPGALQNVLRPDEAEASFPVEDVLANAPRQDDNYFRIRAVLE